MEIITHGDPARIAKVHNERLGLKAFECSKCGCLFKCQRGEYKFHDDQREGSWYDVTCPDCKSDLHTSEYI